MGRPTRPKCKPSSALRRRRVNPSQPERLALFSGGLDSLAGVVAEAIGKKKKLLLLNHRSNDKFSPLYETLFQQLTERVSPT